MLPSTRRYLLAITTALLCLWAFGCDQQNQTGPAPNPAREQAPYLSHEYAKFRASQISDVDYVLSVALDEEAEEFSGDIDIQFTLAKNNSAPVTVDFNQGTIESIKLNGSAISWDYEKWFITLPADVFTRQQNTLSIQYRTPYATNGDGLHRFKDPKTGRVYVYTNFEPYDANRMYPHFDQPNLKASYTLDVLAPASWTVISAVRENKVVDSKGKKHWYFSASPKISSYIFPLHAGPFHVWEDTAGDIPLRLFARQEVAEFVKTDDWFTPTKQSFTFFNDYFELPYPFVKYDQIIVPDFNAGAMENQAAVTFNESYISRGKKTEAQRIRLANVIAHEMAHMWFGNLVTMNWWNGLWLNESFATYMANLELDRASDFENIWDIFYSRTKQWAYQTDQQVTTHPIELPVHTTAEAFTNFDGITYGKGASVLKQLPYYLGEENFRRGVANYLKKFAYQNTELEDFIGELGKAAGMNLDNWTQQWLYQPSLNMIRAEFTCSDGKISQLQLQQSAPKSFPTLREQRLQVGLYKLDKDLMKVVKYIPITIKGETTPIAAAKGVECPDLVYPNADDWGYVKIAFDPVSLKTLKQHINTFETEGMRLILWQNLWDSVRDIQIPVTEYVEFALANIRGEQNYKTVQQVSNSLSKAYSYLWRIDADQKRYAKQRAAIESQFWSYTQQAKPGSDVQKIWFTRFVGVAHTETALNNIDQVLAGKLVLKNLVIDQDMRWSMVKRLNRFLYGNYAELLQAEAKADQSDRGSKQAIAAEVVRPDTQVKEKWLDVVTNSYKEYKLAELRLMLGHLFRTEQTKRIEPYSRRILAVIPALHKEAEENYVNAFSKMLSTATCTEQSVKRLNQIKDDMAKLSPILGKNFKIAHQEDERCVNIGTLANRSRN